MDGSSAEKGLGKLALLSNVNMDYAVRMLAKETEVYRPEGYGNELGVLINPESSYHAFRPDITFLLVDLMELLGHELDLERAAEKIGGWFSQLAGGLREGEVYYVNDAWLWGVELGAAADPGRKAALEGLWLMHALLKAVAPGTRLVFVGDVNQLPSVGPGSVLKDMIESRMFPVVELTKIFRQAAQSDIVRNAHRIHAGETVVLDNKSMDFFFLKRYEADTIIGVMIYLITKKLPGFVGVSPLEIQVLAPMKKGLLGVERLNGILQQYLNPKSEEKKEKECGGHIFREGDKVMQIKNNYQLEWEVQNTYGLAIEKGLGIFNGDMGIVRQINEYADTMTVEFDESRLVEYSLKNLEELELAYAVTIHKSQGSEYPAVVMPLLSGPKMLMNRNLLYTAVTRARKCVVIVGDENAFYAMEENTVQQKRYCGLAEEIQKNENSQAVL